MPEELVLYGNDTYTSPYVFSAFVTLREKNVPFPQEPRARARVRMIQAFLRSDLVPLRAARPTSTFFEAEAPKPFTPEAKASADRLVAVAEQFLPPGGAFVA